MEENKDIIKTIRCTRCAEEFSDAESEGLTCCPKCGDTGVPMLIADDVTVKVNWHELRILGIWAENWAKKIQEDNKDEKKDYLLTVMCIAGRLQKQHPDKAPLTLFSEIRQLRKEIESSDELKGVKIETDIDSDEKLGL
jgi:predicted  nucleic acid-binding Zn-ribbon protein